MYTIPTNVVDNYASNDSLNALIKRIDKTLQSVAIRQYNDIRLGKSNDDVDLDLYDDLTTYRYILLNKLLGCNCLQAQFLIFIVSKIKKLTR